MYVCIYVCPIVASLLIISSVRGCHVDCRFTSSEKMSKNPSRQRRRLWMVALPQSLPLPLPLPLLLLLDDLLKIPFKICLLTLRTTQQTLTRTYTHTHNCAIGCQENQNQNWTVENVFMSGKQQAKQNKENRRNEQREDVAMCVWWADYQHLGKPNKSQ